MAELTRAEFQMWMETLRDDVRGVHDRLDLLNGRTRRNETAIAVIQDRHRHVRRTGAVVSGGIAAVCAGVLEGVRWYLGR